MPDTKVIRFLDHFDSLDPAGRSSLLTILVDWASHQLAGTPPPNPAYEQFSKATSFPGRRGGYRYLDVNLLAGLAKEKEHSQLLDFFRQQQVMDLALVPAEGLAHEPSDLVPVKPAALRRRVNATLQELFAPQVTDIGSETWRYQGQLEGSDLKLDIRYSGRMGRPQLSYNAEVRGRTRAWSTRTLFRVGARCRFRALGLSDSRKCGEISGPACGTDVVARGYHRACHRNASRRLSEFVAECFLRLQKT